jgi:hypothetical protein
MQKRAFERYLEEGKSAAPLPAPTTGPVFNPHVLITAKNLQVPENLRNLYLHLFENHYIDCVTGFNEEILDVFSRDVLQRIKTGDSSWERMVPSEVATAIKKRKLFGYGATVATAK